MPDVLSLVLSPGAAWRRRTAEGWRSWLPLFLMGAAAAVPILVFAAVMFGLYGNQIERALNAMMRRTAHSAMVAVDAHLGEEIAALQALAATSTGDGFDEQAARLIRMRPLWLAVVRAGLDGSVAKIRGPRPLPQLEVDQALLARVAATGEPAIGGVRPADSALEEPHVPIYVPVTADGRVRGVVGAAVSARAFTRLLMQQQPPAGWIVAALDAGGTIAGRSRGHDHEVIGTPATPSLTAGLASGENDLFFSTTKDGERAYTAVTRSARTGWTVAVGAPAAVVEQPLRRTMMLVAGGGVIAFLLAAWAGIGIARGAARRRNAEKRLAAIEAQQTAERRLTDIAANFPGVIYRRVLHRDGTVSYPYLSPSTNAFPQIKRSDHVRRKPPEQGALAFVPEDRAGWMEAMARSAADLSSFHYEGRANTEDGSLCWVRSVALPRREADGSVVWDGVVLDITDLKEAEAGLEASLSEKEGLLREIHHRVRNNLQVVSSLIQIESFQMRDADDRHRLAEVSRRIGALGHLHELLYQSTDFHRVDCGEHLRRLCQSIESGDGRAAAIAVESGALRCDLDTAIPLGLIAHELVSFELAHSERLVVRLARADDGAVELSIDCGCGGEKLQAANGLGSRILQALAAQIDATLSTPGGRVCALLRIAGARFDG